MAARVLAISTARGHPGVLASIVAVGGLVCLFAWVAWRFGPTLTRFCGLASWWAAWACGSQGGYGYMIFFLILGTASWSAGSIWYHARRGRWPSLLAQRLFTRLLGSQRTGADATALTARRDRRWAR
jgi:hypothetical protein